MGELAAGERVDDLAQLRVGLVQGARIVALGFFLFDLLRGEAEEEEVLGADFFANLDVGAVESADGERAVHGELHVAGAGGFKAGERDLLREVGGGIDALAKRHVEVGQEDDLEAVADQRVAMNHGGDGVDELDDELGHVIAGRGFAAEDERARLHGDIGIVLDALVEGEDVQHFEVLALVFVEALDEDVEDGVGIDRDTEGLVDVGGEALLVVVLDVAPLARESASSARGSSLRSFSRS